MNRHIVQYTVPRTPHDPGGENLATSGWYFRRSRQANILKRPPGLSIRCTNTTGSLRCLKRARCF